MKISEKNLRIIFLVISVIFISYLFLFDNFKKKLNIRNSLINEIISENIANVVFPYKVGYLCGMKEVSQDEYKTCQKKRLEQTSNYLNLNNKITLFNFAPEPRTYNANHNNNLLFQKILTFVLYILSLYYIWHYRFRIMKKIIHFYNKI